jgi:ADP-heptose:LPS heptosyltransferase
VRNIAIKSYNGVGDLLFVTPTIRLIKERHPNYTIIMRTNRPELLYKNPHVDVVNDFRPASTHRTDEEGVFLGYPDPIHAKNPTKHHIISDWEIVCKHFELDLPPPTLKPELYFVNGTPARRGIGVQVLHKGHWNKKKIWPHFEELAVMDGFEPIPKIVDLVSGPSVRALAEQIASYKAVVCAEGGISHIAKAVGTPAVVIMGGFHRPEWAGYADHVNIVDRDVWCRDICYNPYPCHHEVERYCMRKISVNEVRSEAQRLIDTYD